MHRAGEKVIPIANSDNKRQITAVLAASMSGEYLAPQLMFKGKTERCHPRVPFPKGWDVWHSDNHVHLADIIPCTFCHMHAWGSSSQW